MRLLSITAVTRECCLPHSDNSVSATSVVLKHLMSLEQIGTGMFASICFPNISEKKYTLYSILFVIPNELQMNAFKCQILLNLFLSLLDCCKYCSCLITCFFNYSLGLPVMYCLLEVVSVYPEKLATRFVDKMDWIKVY